jgi:3-oxoacyl-[acyl-carrier-protein] synthase-3
MTLDKVGNTAAASMPIALSIALEEGRIQPGDKILLVGGAAGFSAGVVPIIW